MLKAEFHLARAFTLRPYQTDLIQQIFERWESGLQRLMLQLATGGGKTVIFSAIAQHFTRENAPILVVAHREELIFQAAEKLEAMTGQECGIIKGNHRRSRECLIQVASIQALIRRQDWPPATLVIIDEGHHSCSQSYQRVFDRYKGAKLLGVTATPARIDGQGFKFIYQDLITGPSVEELINQGYLSPYRLFASPAAIKLRNRKTANGDYSQEQLSKAVDSSLVMGDLISSWRKFANGKRTVVFTISIQHSKTIAQSYTEAGIPAEHLDCDTPGDERKAILERLRTGQTLVLSNCGIVSEGFDLPALEAMQCVRPTQSLILWLQMVGRSLRPSSGKSHAVIIDHTENWIAHGMPDEPREWSLDPISLDPEKRWTAICPKCRHVFLPLPHEKAPKEYLWVPEAQEFKATYCYTCPNCRHIYEVNWFIGNGEPPPPRLVFQDKSADICEIPPDANLALLRQAYTLLKHRSASPSDPAQLFNQMICSLQLGVKEAQAVARMLGFNSDWAEERWAEVLAFQIKKAQTWKDIESLMSINKVYRESVWRALSTHEKTRIKQLKLFGIASPPEEVDQRVDNPPTDAESSKGGKNEIQVGDRIFVNPWPHTDKLGPYSVERIEGDRAKIEFFEQLVPLSDLRRT